MRSTARAVLGASSIAMAVAVAGCGGSDPGPEAATGGAPHSPSSSAVSTASPSLSGVAHTATEPMTKDVRRHVYYAGYKITVGKLTYTPPDADDVLASGKVELAVSFDNLGTTNGEIDSMAMPMDLASGNHHYRSSLLDPITVPGEAEQDATLTFDVDDEFSLDTATLTFGDAASAQSVMPLGDPGSPADNAPQPVTVDSSVTAKPVTVTFTGAKVLAALPDNHQQAAKDKRYLLLDYSATAPAGAKDSTVVSYDSFTLTEPDGTTQQGYDLADSYATAVTVEPGGSKKAFVVFTIDAPTKGHYMVTFENSETTVGLGGASTSKTSGKTTFELP